MSKTKVTTHVRDKLTAMQRRGVSQEGQMQMLAEQIDLLTTSLVVITTILSEQRVRLQQLKEQ